MSVHQEFHQFIALIADKNALNYDIFQKFRKLNLQMDFENRLNILYLTNADQIHWNANQLEKSCSFCQKPFYSNFREKESILRTLHSLKSFFKHYYKYFSNYNVR